MNCTAAYYDMEQKCPTCNTILEKDKDSNSPFCSERCRLIDLGDWFSEKNRLPSDDFVIPDTLLDINNKQ